MKIDFLRQYPSEIDFYKMLFLLEVPYFEPQIQYLIAKMLNYSPTCDGLKKQIFSYIEPENRVNQAIMLKISNLPK